jgi:hypothetical protein
MAWQAKLDKKLRACDDIGKPVSIENRINQ